MTDKPEVAGVPADGHSPVAAAKNQRPYNTPVRPGSPMIVLMVVSLVVVFLALGNISEEDAALVGATLAPSMVALIWLGCYLLTSHLAFGTPYLFATAYVVCLFVFHLGLLIQDGFGLVRIMGWESGPLAPWVVRAGWYTNLALACVGAGFSAYALKFRAQKPPRPEVARSLVAQNFAWLHHQGLGLLLASGILLVAAIATQGNIFALTRMKLFFLSDTRFISVFSMLVPGAATALIIAAQNQRQRRIAYLVAALVFIFFLVSGQRSTALFPLLVGAVVWVKSGRRINAVVAGATILGVLLVIPVVGYLRTLGTYGDITSGEAFSEADQFADIGAAFREMGGSIGPLIYTLMLIPAEEQYRYGRSYRDYFLDVIPNVGLRADVSTSRAGAEELLRSKPTQEALLAMQPGDWATYHIIRDQFAGNRGGAGFSGVAEPYFNFGLAGVLVYFLAIGLFLGKFDCLPLVFQRGWLMFGAVIYWHLLPTVRNGFGIFLKPAVFTLIVLLIWRLVRRFVPPRQQTGPPKPVATQKLPDSPPRTPDRADPRRPAGTPPHRSPPRG
jgi:oligosaccharide repeat unit polymerase